MVPATISVVLDDAVEAAAEQRRLGRLDDARATAARLMALARRLVREYPDSAHSYRVLSDAHNQIKKNAFKTDDDKLIEEALVQAIEAAQQCPRPGPRPARNTTPSGQAHRTARQHQSRSEGGQCRAFAIATVNSHT